MPGADQNYLAIIGDLVGSRALSPEERAEVQLRFKAVLDKINKDFKSEIASLFLITIGDEAQGILKRPNLCYQILRQIQIELAPTEIVFGLGFASLTTEIGKYAIGTDGPAFHFARQALTESKEERRAYGKSILREVRLHSDNPLRDSTIDSMFLAISVLKSDWTQKQASILRLLEQGKNASEVAKSLDVPLSNVSRTIENAHHREFEVLVESLQTMFGEHFDDFGKAKKLSKKR